MTETRSPTDGAPRDRVAILVLGMHRSGTSALAGALSKLGAALPGALMAGDAMNAKGYFESNLVTDLNNRLLDAARRSWWDTRRMAPEWLSSPAGHDFLKQAEDVLRSDFGDAPLFVLKDPRICRLMPYWRAALDRFGARPVVVHTHRHPREVAASMLRSQDLEAAYGLVLWLKHLLDAEADSRDLPRVFTTYQGLLDDPEGSMGRIADGLGIDWPRDVADAGGDIRDFLSRGLRNFEETDPDGTAALPAAMRTVLEIFDRWAETGETEADRAALDTVREGLALTGPLYDDLAVAAVHRRLQIMSTSAQLSQANQRLANQTARASALEGQLAALELRHQDVRQALAALQARHGALQQERDATATRLHEMNRREAAFLSSASWRVTAPLRRVSRLVRGLL